MQDQSNLDRGLKVGGYACQLDFVPCAGIVICREMHAQMCG